MKFLSVFVFFKANGQVPADLNVVNVDLVVARLGEYVDVPSVVWPQLNANFRQRGLSRGGQHSRGVVLVPR